MDLKPFVVIFGFDVVGLFVLAINRLSAAFKFTCAFIIESSVLKLAPALALILPLPACNSVLLMEPSAFILTSPPPCSIKLAKSGLLFVFPPMRALLADATCILATSPPASIFTFPPPNVPTPLVKPAVLKGPEVVA